MILRSGSGALPRYLVTSLPRSQVQPGNEVLEAPASPTPDSPQRQGRVQFSYSGLRQGGIQPLWRLLYSGTLKGAAIQNAPVYTGY